MINGESEVSLKNEIELKFWDFPENEIELKFWDFSEKEKYNGKPRIFLQKLNFMMHLQVWSLEFFFSTYRVHIL